MTDIFEQGSAREEQDRELAIRFSSRLNAAPATGKCLFCGEAVGEGNRFCDSFCRDDYQRELDAQARNGGG